MDEAAHNRYVETVAMYSDDWADNVAEVIERAGGPTFTEVDGQYMVNASFLEAAVLATVEAAEAMAVAMRLISPMVAPIFSMAPTASPLACWMPETCVAMSSVAFAV